MLINLWVKEDVKKKKIHCWFSKLSSGYTMVEKLSQGGPPAPIEDVGFKKSVGENAP